MEREIEHRSAPTLVFLDPEGFAVNWGTVDRLSKFREGGRRVELLLLAMTSGIQRVAAAQDPTTKATVLDWALPPGGDWLTVSDQYLGGEITGGQARDRWAKAYESGLRELGYTYVLSRAVSWRGSSSDPAAYHLVFASDHQAGERIMRYAFDNMFSNAGANVFPGFLDDG
jgi:three-Cys-motif partner protein